MGISNIPDAVVVMDPPLQKAFEAKGFKSVAESKTISNLVKQIVGEIVDEWSSLEMLYFIEENCCFIWKKD